MRPPHLDLPEARLRLVGFAVSRLSVTPVKGLALQAPDEIELTAEGLPDNRQFYLVDLAGFLFSGIDHGPLCRIRPSYDRASEQLALEFPDGTTVEGSAARHHGGRRYGVLWQKGDGEGRRRPVRRRPQPLRREAATTRPRPINPGAAFDVQPVTFLSDASVEELRRQASREEPVDERRFRMLVGLAGCRAARGGRVERAAPARR